MQAKTFDQQFDEARRKAELRRAGAAISAAFDPWGAQIAVADEAIAVLWAAVKDTRQRDFRLEQQLWARHRQELLVMKRRMDAVVM